MRKKEGFTLIELMVSISIVAILSATAMIVYSGITARAHDSQRIRDLQSIKQALELYRSDVHNYPATTVLNLNTMTELKNGTSATYLSPIPVDKDSSRKYYYLALPNSPVCDNTSLAKACTGFVLCAKKESNGVFDKPNECSMSCGVAGNCDIGISSQ